MAHLQVPNGLRYKDIQTFGEYVQANKSLITYRLGNGNTPTVLPKTDNVVRWASIQFQR